MKVHTSEFKEQIKELGRELDSIITFGNTTLGSSELNAVTPSFQGSILKSVMKQLDIDSNVEIPIGTILKYEFGLKVNGEYEYLDFGNYIVKSVEKQEDTKSYKVVCYDKMLYSMVDYVGLNITFPITIRDYIKAICDHLGLVFANDNDTFANYDKVILNELYLDGEGNTLGYTFRDVFDELAQATASTICLNENDEVEIRYINDTNDTIDEEYLKDVNVNFGEKYGPINSIVLSRAGESDNVYLRDEQSVEQNGLCELKIIDNQIMNFNNRSDYLLDILAKLNGLEYYINDFVSTGICYYDVCDRYNVQIDDQTYSCVMFNDEVLITRGLEENIYTEMPKETKTDYTKADKTDRKINQTYIIVDKQNQQIEAVVSQTDEQNQKIARVTQTVDELNSKISDIADITISAEDNDAQVELDNINQSEPIRIVVRPIGESISYLYPSNNLFPSDTLFPKNRKIRFTNTETEEIIDYELPTDLLYYNSENYDEFILDYDAQTCIVNKKVGYNQDGTTYILDSPTTLEFEYPRILLTDGDYGVSVLGYNTAYLFVRLMAQNIYTTQFATRAEVTSEINQTANAINLKVEQKLDGEDFNGANIVLEINKDTSLATIDADKISLKGKEINLTGDNTIITSNNFNVDANGNLTCENAEINGTVDSSSIIGGSIQSSNYNYSNKTGLYIDLNDGRITSYNGISFRDNSNYGTSISGGDIETKKIEVINDLDGNIGTQIYQEYVKTYSYQNFSKEELKKNFEIYTGALEKIKNTDIYKYNYKNEEDGIKKHIGCVIGKKYKCNEDILSNSGDSIDIYSMLSVLWQGVKEQQEIINQLKEEITLLKESDK